MSPDIVLGVLSAVMNFLGFILMAVDKKKAKSRKSRIPESTFALITLFYGGLGIILSGVLFSHKTSKRSFIMKILTCFTINVLITIIVLEKIA